MASEQLTEVFTSIFNGVIYGTPKAQPRPRAFARNGKARMYDPGTAEAWKSDISGQTEALHNMQLDGPLKVYLYFFMQRPKAHYKSDGVTFKLNAPYDYTKKPDCDNLAKAVLDACTALGVWKDDSQVVILEIIKAWSSTTRSGCVLQILTITRQ
jgi:Holliday junction resolvase RusA-like endonuclease